MEEWGLYRIARDPKGTELIDEIVRNKLRGKAETGMPVTRAKETG